MTESLEQQRAHWLSLAESTGSRFLALVYRRKAADLELELNIAQRSKA